MDSLLSKWNARSYYSCSILAYLRLIDLLRYHNHKGDLLKGLKYAIIFLLLNTADNLTLFGKAASIYSLYAET